MSQNGEKKATFFVSLRIKLLVLFTLLFAVALVGAFFWFTDFATNLALERLREDLLAIAQSTAQDVSGTDGGKQHTDLASLGSDGMDNEVYLEINEQLRRAKWNNPKAAGVYTLVQNEADAANSVVFVVSAALPPVVEATERDQVVIEAKLEGCTIDPTSRPPIGIVFRRGDFPDSFIDATIRGLEEPVVMENIYTDPFGTWLTAVAPIRDANGNSVGAVAIDACATDIQKIRDDIRNNLLLAMIGAFIILTVVVYLAAYSITRPIAALTSAAEQIGSGRYDQDLSNLTGGRFGDEVTTLAGVFDIMVDKVAEREETLKKKVASLQIIIDEGKRDKQVAELTENDFFLDIKAKAEKLRKEKKKPGEDDSAGDESDA